MVSRPGHGVAQPGQGLQVRRSVPGPAGDRQLRPDSAIGPGQQRAGPGRRRPGPRTGRAQPVLGLRGSGRASGPGRSRRPRPAGRRSQRLGGGHRTPGAVGSPLRSAPARAAPVRPRVCGAGPASAPPPRPSPASDAGHLDARPRAVQAAQVAESPRPAGSRPVLAVPARTGPAPGSSRDFRAAQQRVDGTRTHGRRSHDRGVPSPPRRRQQHGRDLTEHLGRVFQPELLAQHRRRHQRLPARWLRPSSRRCASGRSTAAAVPMPARRVRR